MTLNEEQRNELIQYRIKLAKETSEDAALLINNHSYRSAVNRIYYAMFYMLMALALKFHFETSKHQQLIGWFNKNFVKTDKIPVEYSKSIQKAYKNRIKGDYDDMMGFSKDEVVMMQKEMQDFINYLENYINEL